MSHTLCISISIQEAELAESNTATLTRTPRLLICVGSKKQ